MVEGQFDVQARRCQTEFAGCLIAQVGLEQPLALRRACAAQLVVEVCSRCARAARRQRAVQRLTTEVRKQGRVHARG